MRIATKIGLLILIIFGLFWAAGFGKAGIKSESLAALIQSMYGKVEKGSWFALLNSWGAKGYFVYGVNSGAAIIILDLIYVLLKIYNKSTEELHIPRRDEPNRRNDPEVPKLDGVDMEIETKDPRIVALNKETPQAKPD